MDVTLLDYTGINQRDFGEWSMAYIRDDEIDQAALQKIGRPDHFDPFDLLPGEALDFLKIVTAAHAEKLDQQQAMIEAR